MAGLIPQSLRIPAGNLKDLDDLLVCIMHRLSGARAVIKESRNSLLQAGRVFFGNLLQKGEFFNKAAPPFADRILPKAYLLRYLHVIKTISSQKDYLCALYLTGWKGSASGKFKKDRADGFRYYDSCCNKWHMDRLLVFSFYYAIY